MVKGALDLFISVDTTFKNFGILAQPKLRNWTWRRRMVFYVNLKPRVYSEASIILDFCITDPQILMEF